MIKMELETAKNYENVYFLIIVKYFIKNSLNF